MANDPNENPGVTCPRCGCRHLKAIETRRRGKRNFRWRRCRHCGQKVRTTEMIIQIKPE